MVYFFIFKKFSPLTLNAATRLVGLVVIVVKQQDPSQLNKKKIAETETINIHFISLC